MSHVTLVVNPTAGRGRAVRSLPEVAGVLRDAGHAVTLQLSRTPGEARALVGRAVRDGTEVLAVMGGDGMMHLGLNACADAVADGTGSTLLGLVPAGTGNDLCRGLGLDPDDPVAAAAVVAGGRAQPVDLMEVGDRIVGAVLATGFDALVNARANALSWPRGALRYTVATLAEVSTFAPLRYRLTLDGEVRDLDAMLVAVGNTACYGGGLRICPDADPRDGLLDVTIIHPVSRLTLLRLLPQLPSGRFVRHPCVERVRAREVTVEGGGWCGFGDGEPIGPTPLRVRVRPAAQPVLLPSSP